MLREMASTSAPLQWGTEPVQTYSRRGIGGLWPLGSAATTNSELRGPVRYREFWRMRSCATTGSVPHRRGALADAISRSTAPATGYKIFAAHRAAHALDAPRRRKATFAARQIHDNETMPRKHVFHRVSGVLLVVMDLPCGKCRRSRRPGRRGREQPGGLRSFYIQLPELCSGKWHPQVPPYGRYSNRPASFRARSGR